MTAPARIPYSSDGEPRIAATNARAKACSSSSLLLKSHASFLGRFRRPIARLALVERHLLGNRFAGGSRTRAGNGPPGRQALHPSRQVWSLRRVPLPSDVLAECSARVGRVSAFDAACDFDKRVRDLSGIEQLHSHICWHTFATEWRGSGGSLAALQAVLGHGSITVTERYGTIGDDLVQREAQRLVEYRSARGR